MKRLTLCGLAVVAVAAACGGKSSSSAGPDPTDWASDVCTMLAGASEAGARPFREAQAEVQSATEFHPRRVRRLLVGAASESLRVYDETIAKLDAIGAPAVEDGKAIQRLCARSLFW